MAKPNSIFRRYFTKLRNFKTWKIMSPSKRGTNRIGIKAAEVLSFFLLVLNDKFFSMIESYKEQSKRGFFRVDSISWLLKLLQVWVIFESECFIGWYKQGNVKGKNNVELISIKFEFYFKCGGCNAEKIVQKPEACF